MLRPFLVTERLHLRPLSESDCNGDYVDWLNDEDVCRGNSHHVFPYTRDAALAYVRSAQQTRDDLILAIDRRDEARHIGNIALQGIHRVYRSAELAILIGDKKSWGQGFGQEAARALCRHGFVALNLHRIACGTFEDNTGMQRLARWLGMKEEGRRRQAAYKAGRYVDVIEYGVLRHEFLTRFPLEEVES